MKKNISIFEFKTGTEYLNTLYKSIAETNPRYSLRSFAQKIGLDQSSLVRYLAGERSLSPNKSHVIAENLKLSEVESHYFKLLTSFGDKGEYEILERLRTGFLFDKQAKNQFLPDNLVVKNQEYILDLKIYVLLQLQNLKDEVSVPDFAKVLNRFFETDETQIVESLDKLIEMGFLEQADNNKRRLLLKNFFFTEDVPREAGIKFHRDSMAVANRALVDYDKADMEVYTSVIAVKKEGREKIHEAIRHLHGLLTEFSTEEADDAFLVTAYMVNLTSDHQQVKQ
jgi:hypothetical protein